MKRGWIGVGLLTVILILGFLTSWWMGKTHSRIAVDLDRAAGYALAENWEQAAAYAQKAKNHWQKRWHFSAAFADHEPMENIDSQLSQLSFLASARDEVTFAALCAQLSRQMEAMGEAHSLNWWNLL